MMLGLLGALLLPPLIESRWPLPEGASLLYREGAGYAYVAGSKVVLVSSEVKVQGTMPYPSGRWPLYLAKEEGVVTTVYPLINGSKLQMGGHGIRSQGKHLFLEGRTTTYVGPGPSHSLGSFSSVADACAASPDGNTIAILTMPEVTPCLRISRLFNDAWVDDARVRFPEIEDVGYCTPLPGYNDLVFVGNDVIAYVGGFTGPHNEKRLDELIAKVPELPGIRLGFPKGNDGMAFLFVTRIRDGLTRPYAKLTYRHGRERSGIVHGRFIASGDGKKLLLNANGEVLVFDAEAMREAFKRPIG